MAVNCWPADRLLIIRSSGMLSAGDIFAVEASRPGPWLQWAGEGGAILTDRAAPDQDRITHDARVSVDPVYGIRPSAIGGGKRSEL